MFVSLLYAFSIRLRAPALMVVAFIHAQILLAGKRQ